tara:strand:+ start:8230 stop:8772 length:543 start_codon:yes stop_codon:yes gene_type:complete
MILSEKGEKEALKLSRWSLNREIKQIDSVKPVTTDPEFKNRHGVFVTITLIDELRGCVGRVEPINILDKEIYDLTLSSALNDPRFPSVDLSIVEQLKIEISILSKPDIFTNIDDIKIGRDGLMVEKADYRGLLLPQVAEEEDWDITTFVSQTCLKAGLPSESWKSEDTILYKFTAQKFSE